MKRNLLGLTAVVLAIVFSAFSNVKLKDTKTYFHVGNKFIETLQPGLSCQPDDVCCRLIFNGTNLPSGDFAEDNIPSNPTDYTVTRQEENASYQE